MTDERDLDDDGGGAEPDGAGDPVVAVVLTAPLVEAEAVARWLRGRDIAAMIDPEQLRGMDVQRGDHGHHVRVIVPVGERDAAEAALADHQAREGTATEAEILAELGAGWQDRVAAGRPPQHPLPDHSPWPIPPSLRGARPALWIGLAALALAPALFGGVGVAWLVPTLAVGALLYAASRPRR